jgi:hypothetical protein
MSNGASRDRPGSVGTSGRGGSSRDRGGITTSGRATSTSTIEGRQKKKKKYKRTLPRGGTFGYNPDPSWSNKN